MPPLRIQQKDKPCNKAAPMSAQHAGFTLVELAVVFLVIAFLTGVVLMAQSMIEQSVARKDLLKIQEVITAMHTFESKYGYLPGDLPNHAAFFKAPVPAGYTGGNGDGRVGISTGGAGNETAYCTAGCAGDQGAESTVFWLELAETSLIKHPLFPFSNALSDVDSFAHQGIGYPAIQGGTKYGLTVTSTLTEKPNVLIYGASQPWVGNQAVFFGNIMPSDFSKYIDQKMDDGKPMAGRVQNHWTIGDAVTPFLSANCNNGSGNYPDGNSTTLICSLRIETNL
jgi:type II secretory pathway pseudopilin PulG